MNQQVGGEFSLWIDSAHVEILVVEDSPTQALCLQGALEDAGYKATIARDGEQALEYLKDHRPTLIVSDIVMPGIDGYELCRLVKADKELEDTPVLLVTSLSDPADILNGLRCGADNFITKPYQERELLSRIQYLLVNRDLRRRSAAGLGVEIYFAGRKHFLTAERMQILDLLISSFETAVTHKLEVDRVNRQLKQLNEKLVQEVSERKKSEREKERLITELQQALVEVKKLSGLLPICASCKRIRDDKGYWRQIEAYIRDHSEADFSHGICPKCVKEFYPEFAEDEEE
ncbi:MAG: response regulator [Desulfomonile tiedjei]|uniref:Response regulator n=1 Tax=Desulfomonile tiedjei TaxID=2358 RepID=A0A9D6V136_9BACT|nr:response regulator [Desulfomonile tiedjei]